MKRTYALLLMALSLSACDVGEGNRPESIRFITSSSDNTTLESTTVFQCFAQSLLVLGEFTDNVPGDFTSRVTYSSDREDIVKVSNGDVPIPGKSSQNYSRGVLLPVSTGTATVTAEFAGLQASIQVTVRAPNSIVVSNEQMTDSDGITQHAVQAMVPGSVQQLVATAIVDDDGDGEKEPREISVAAVGDWVTTAPSDIATVGAVSGVIGALKVPDVATEYTATVSFPPCSGLDGAPSLPGSVTADNLKASFSVREPARKLVIVTEPRYPAQNGQMPAGTAQLLRVLADFDTDAANGEGQDLTFKGITIETEPTGVFSYSSSSGLLLAGSLDSGQTSDAAAVTASFGEEDELCDFCISDPLNMNVIAATLDSVSISTDPAEVEPLQIEALGTKQFRATGTFTVSGQTSKLVLPIEHDVRWTSSDATVVTLSNFTLTAGKAFSLKDEATTDPVTIKAQSIGLIPKTDTSAVEQPSDSVELSVVLPGAE